MKKWLLLLFFPPLLGLGQNTLLEQAISLQNFYPDSAIGLAEQVVAADTSARIRSNALEVIGIANWVKAQYSAAIAAHQRALQLREDIGYENGVAHSLNNLGLNYHGLGDKTTAIDFYLNGLDRATEIPDSGLMASILGNIGILYEEQGEDDKALEFHQKSLAIAKTGHPTIDGKHLEQYCAHLQEKGGICFGARLRSAVS